MMNVCLLYSYVCVCVSVCVRVVCAGMVILADIFAGDLFILIISKCIYVRVVGFSPLPSIQQTEWYKKLLWTATKRPRRTTQRWRQRYWIQRKDRKYVARNHRRCCNRHGLFLFFLSFASLAYSFIYIYVFALCHRVFVYFILCEFYIPFTSDKYNLFRKVANRTTTTTTNIFSREVVRWKQYRITDGVMVMMEIFGHIVVIILIVVYDHTYHNVLLVLVGSAASKKIEPQRYVKRVWNNCCNHFSSNIRYVYLF